MEQTVLQEMEKALAFQFMDKEDNRIRAYICSPLSAKTDEEFVENMYQAKRYMYHAMMEMDLATRAPHAYLPMLLCDRLPAERALALRFGLSLLEESDILLVCGDRISTGMKGEILHAIFINIKIVAFTENMYQQIREFFKKEGGDMELVSYEKRQPFMAGKERK